MTQGHLELVKYESRPVLLVLADSDASVARAREAANAAGCRVADAIDLHDAPDRLDRQIIADVILLEIEQDHGPSLDRILDRLELSARTASQRSIISTPFELIDCVSARTWHRCIAHLVNSTAQDRTHAVIEASAPAETLLQDRKSQPRRLLELSTEVGRIADILATLSEDMSGGSGNRSGDAEIAPSDIRAIIKARRLRERYFAADLFADPAFDMLLDLMAARLEDQRVAVSSLCIAAAVPPTTALRWIKALTDQGMFVRTADPQDGRRVFIELSDAAAAQFGAYLSAVQRIAPSVM